ncbi:CapA family protein [Pararhizobium sp. A13]|uniref:CapA family protein n=1 Tax=Pararhizobium sp. A13 TaxID=3133975 RepID=UPI00311B0D10
MGSSFTVAVTGQSLIRHDLRAVVDPRFLAVIDIIKAAEVSITNFEMTVYGRHGGWPMKGSYFGCAPPEVMAALKFIGFNTVALANNHAFDLGPSGVLSTLEEASANEFLHAGIGIDRQHAGRVIDKTFPGNNIGLIAMDAGPGLSIMYADDSGKGRPARPGVNQLKVSRLFEVEPPVFNFLRDLQENFQSSYLERANYAQPEDPPNVAGAKEIDFYGTIFRRSDRNLRRILVDPRSALTQLAEIRRSAARGTFVIAYLHHHHWEPDWRIVPTWVQEFARLCIDAGARMFVSHGAPVLQAIEIYRKAPIFYGLGNFLFHAENDEEEWSPREVWESVIASCVFDRDGALRSIDLHPIVIGGTEALNDRQKTRLPFPILVHGATAQDILVGLADRCRMFQTHLTRDGNLGQINVADMEERGWSGSSESPC